MTQTSRWAELKRLVREELQLLLTLKPSDRLWQMPFAAALATGLPLLIGAVFRHRAGLPGRRHLPAQPALSGAGGRADAAAGSVPPGAANPHPGAWGLMQAGTGSLCWPSCRAVFCRHVFAHNWR